MARDPSHDEAMALIKLGIVPSGKHRGKSIHDLNWQQCRAIAGALEDPNRQRRRSFDEALVAMLASKPKWASPPKRAKAPKPRTPAPVKVAKTEAPVTDGTLFQESLPGAARDCLTEVMDRLSGAVAICESEGLHTLAGAISTARASILDIVTANPDPTDIPFKV